ncbi:MAG: DUF2778 domain-containing protein [Treponema sp.]|nr:DUF2778 domain-containing protein [Treponema sp.]
MTNKKILGFLVLVFWLVIGTVGAFAEDYYYHISSGIFEAKEDNTVLWRTTCYSGVTGIYRNNPAQTGERNYGPIPEGIWYITDVTQSKGPVTIVLVAAQRSQLKGRDDDFRIHGDNSYAQASAGCIIMDRAYRERIARAYNSGSNPILYVTAY